MVRWVSLPWPLEFHQANCQSSNFQVQCSTFNQPMREHWGASLSFPPSVLQPPVPSIHHFKPASQDKGNQILTMVSGQPLVRPSNTGTIEPIGACCFFLSFFSITETTQQACRGALGNPSKGTITTSNCQRGTGLHSLLATGTMAKLLNGQRATVQGASNGSGVVWWLWWEKTKRTKL